MTGVTHGHEGHRKRIIQKLESGALQQHELLEVLLFNAVPRRNTNDLAHRLLAEFGTIKGIFSASMQQLQRVAGVGENVAAYLYCVGRFIDDFLALEEEVYPKTFDRDSFLPFVKRAYAALKREVVDAYLLDHDGNIFMRKRFENDSMYSVKFAPEELARVLSLGEPAGLVLVHNHPFGKADSSETDDAMTTNCQLICSMQNVLLCDHVIYAPDGVYSYYLSGKLKKISEKYSIKKVFP
ncbi:MAG: hypothetical protein IKD47_06145 [Clostridia bacterium]|nr:hypothetical protein [Clostridia bacterium]